jgi:transposase
MVIKFDLKMEFKNVVLTTAKIKNTYLRTFPNSKYSLDFIIDEIIYVLQSGVSWRMLRSAINYKTLWWHYNNFVNHDVFTKLFNKVKRTYLHKFINPSNHLFIDSTIIYNKYGINKIGRNKFYKSKNTTKISLLTDINGVPLSIFFMKGNYHDTTVFEKHIKDVLLIFPKKEYKIIADKGYSSLKNYTLLEQHGLSHIIPPRKNMKLAKTYRYNKNDYLKRIKIEHIFARLKMFKRISQRNDKYLRNFAGFTYLAFSIIAANILNK